MSVAGSSHSADSGERPQERRFNWHGGLCVCLIVAQQVRWADFRPDSVPASWVEPVSAGSQLVVGVALASEFTFAPLGSEVTGAAHRFLRQHADRRSRGCRQKFGYVESIVSSVVPFAEFVHLDSRESPRSLIRRLANRSVTVTENDGRDVTLPLSFVLQTWEEDLQHKLGSFVFGFVGPGIAHALVEVTSSCITCVAITAKLRRKQLLLPRRPSPRQLQAFVAWPRDRGSDADGGDDELALPQWRAFMVRPELVLEWFGFSRFLKDISQANLAMESCTRIMAAHSLVDPKCSR